jgi:hypothetical protein
VSRDDPVLADDALDGVELPFVVLARRVGGDVDVVAVVEERGAFVGRRQLPSGRLVQVEGLDDIGRVDLRVAVQVDPQQLRPTEATRAFGKPVEVVDLMAVEEDRVAHVVSASDRGRSE